MGAKSYKETEARSEHFIPNTDGLENGKSVTWYSFVVLIGFSFMILVDDCIVLLHSAFICSSWFVRTLSWIPASRLLTGTIHTKNPKLTLDDASADVPQLQPSFLSSRG